MKKQIMSIMSAAAFAVQLAVPYAVFAKSENVTKFIFSDSGISADDGDYTGYKISGTDLTINSSGTYEVSGNCADGSITVKKGTTGVSLILNGITLSSKDTAPICFNKSSEATLTAKEGSVNTLSDSSENNDDNYPDNTNAENAVIKCKDGSDVVIDGSGTINITANGKNGIKSGASTDEDGDASLTVKDAVLNIEAPVNDAINAEAELNIKSGSLNISAADDAVHSDYTLNIGEQGGTNQPEINISSCEEGLEGANVYVYSGDIKINSNDDGINAANSDLKGYRYTLDISGGNVYVNAEKGDGIDSNGTLTISGGNVRVFSTSSGANSPIDSDGTFTITGGTVLAVGNSGMAQNPADGSQNYITFGAGSRGFMQGGGRDFRRMKNENSADNGRPQPPQFDENSGDIQPPQNDDNGRPQPPNDSNMQPPQGDENGNNGQPPQNPDDSGSTGTSVSISANDKLAISDSRCTVFSAAAVRSANYVFYSDSSLSEDETYTLKINNTDTATTTVTDSKNTQSGMQPPQGDFGRPNENNRPQDSFRDDNKKDNSSDKKHGFKDVSEDSWYNNAIWYIFEKNLMNGITDEEFSPDSTITRGMFVTVLYRMENEPETTGKNKFTDVSDDAYYRDAVIWAAENGLVNGITENEFEPDKSISREEMAAIAYRYAKYKGADLQTDKNEKYDDDEKISDFAKESVSWASSKEIMNGSDGKFTPKNGSTRAQAAAVFMRLIENLK